MTLWTLITSTAFTAMSTLSTPEASPPIQHDPSPPADAASTVSADTAMELVRQWKRETESLRRGLAEKSPPSVMDRLRMLHSLEVSGPAPSPDDSGELAPQATALYRRIQAELKAIQEVSEQIESWEENLQINELRGHAGHTLMRAEAFSVERKYRRELQERVRRTTELLEQWALVHEFLLADQSRRLSRMLVLLSLEEAERAARNGRGDPPTAIETYEYFEVQTAATIREISGLPEVYGDPEQWEALYRANRDQIPDPRQEVAQGTVLVVPHQRTTRAFEF